MSGEPRPGTPDASPVARAPSRAVWHGPAIHADGTTTLQVWAPRAAQVAVSLADTDVGCDATAPGWWAATVRAGHGDRYAFRLDGGPPLPDPASRAQPEGVHEPSAVVDPRRLAVPRQAWSPPGLHEAVLYELHIGAFSDEGTLDAATAALPRLAELGVTHVELMPVNAFDGDFGWGYDGVGWFAVHRAYGGPEALARFVAAARQHGLAVLLDVVHNHLGPSGNYLPDFGPYLADRRAGHWGEGLNLDGPGADAVRALIGDNVRWWLDDLRIDGLRLDAVHALVDTSARHIQAELRDVADEVAAARGWPALLIAESDRNDPAEISGRAHGGLGMDAVWADELHHALHQAATGERHAYYVDFRGLADVAAAYQRGFVHDGGRYSTYRGRTPGAPLGAAPGWRLVGCLQNHDQVGNRAHGERVTALADAATVRAVTALLVAAPHTPMLFMGEEHGATTPFLFFAGHPEPELAEAVRTGRREELAGHPGFDAHHPPPDPTDPATFAASKLDWTAAVTPAGLARTALWRDLLALRRSKPALQTGPRPLVEVLAADETSLALVRGHDEALPVLVTANLTVDDVWLPAPGAAGSAGVWAPLLSTDDVAYGGHGRAGEPGDGQVRVPTRTAVLWWRPR